MKTKAALLVKPKKFEIVEQDLKKIKKDYVLVKVHKTGICGSDLHYFRHGGLGSHVSKVPLSLGHEASGVVIDKNNSKFKNFDKIVIDPLNLSECKNLVKNHQCIFCEDKINLCDFGSYLGSYPQLGTFRDFIFLHESQLTICNSEIFDHAQMVEPLGIAMYAVNQSKIDYQKNNNVMIIGAGAIGMLITEILKVNGVENITIVDKINYRLDFAKKKININIKNFDDKEYFRNKQNTYNFIFDVVLDNKTIDLSFSSIKKRGKYVIVGIPSVDSLVFNPHLIRIKEIEISNVRRSNIQMEEILDFINEKKIKLKDYVTHNFKIEQIQQAFEIASNYQNNIIRGCVG